MNNLLNKFEGMTEREILIVAVTKIQELDEKLDTHLKRHWAINLALLGTALTAGASIAITILFTCQ